MAKWALICLLAALIAEIGCCLNILQFVPGYSRSHVMFNNRLASALMKQGHNVTMVRIMDTAMKADDMPVPKGAVEHRLMFDYGDTFRIGFRSLAFKELTLMTMMELGPAWFGAWNRVCETYLDDIDINGWHLGGRFDLALLHPMDICSALMSEALSVRKSVVYSPGAFLANEFYAYHSGVPMWASYIPQSVTKFSDQMSYWQRVSNTLVTILHTYDVYIDNPSISLGYQQALYFGRPPHDDREDAHAVVRRAVEYMLINGYVELDFPRPLPLSFHHMSELSAGGKPTESNQPAKLEPKWEKMLSSKKGTIIFSFGTIAKTSEIPTDMRLALLGALAKFTDYSVIWRFEETFPEADQYQHIHLVSWLPQKELLADERTRLFITHAGYNSLLESTQAGVPMVLIPLFVDQYGNAMRAVRLNIGVNIQKNAITADSFAEAIDHVLKDHRFAEQSKRLAKILEDSMIDPDVALSYHLRTAAKEQSAKFTSLIRAQNLTFFQYHCADIFAIYVTIALISWHLIY